MLNKILVVQCFPFSSDSRKTFLKKIREFLGKARAKKTEFLYVQSDYQLLQWIEKNSNSILLVNGNTNDAKRIVKIANGKIPSFLSYASSDFFTEEFVNVFPGLTSARTEVKNSNFIKDFVLFPGAKSIYLNYDDSPSSSVDYSIDLLKQYKKQNINKEEASKQVIAEVLLERAKEAPELKSFLNTYTEKIFTNGCPKVFMCDAAINRMVRLASPAHLLQLRLEKAESEHYMKVLFNEKQIGFTSQVCLETGGWKPSCTAVEASLLKNRTKVYADLCCRAAAEQYGNVEDDCTWDEFFSSI